MFTTALSPDMAFEPIIQLSGTRDNSVHLVPLLHSSLDQPDAPGWPVITPLKVQLLKCEKCSLEFCSPINYKRHARIHRRSWKVDKEYGNLRTPLAEFWDKCSIEERKQVVSFDDIMLKKTPGSSVIDALDAALLEAGIWGFPYVYIKAGSKLLGVIRSSPSISSRDLFGILDDASEGTFLFTGAAECVQNFIFDGDAFNSLEWRNLIASTCFLFELQLVKAWVADKDAEALRCQKLLVEEEEAERNKREAKLAKKRRQKKLRHKELKTKEQQQPPPIPSPSSSSSSSGSSENKEESFYEPPADDSSSPGGGDGDGIHDLQISDSERDDSDEKRQTEIVIGSIPVSLPRPPPPAESTSSYESTAFSVDAAREFLARRWREVMSGEYVKLRLHSAEEEMKGEEGERGLL